MSIMEKLTERQEEILLFIHSHEAKNGYWPSIREIQVRFGFRSTNAVAGHLDALERKGCLERIAGQARTFRIHPEIVEQIQSLGLRDTIISIGEIVDTIPIQGLIAAGYPDLVESGGEIGRLRIDAQTAFRARAENGFCVRVRGDSMINAGIHDGDHIIAVAREPRDQDIVVALIDGETTLKRFIKKHRSHPYLKAENPDYPELYPINELTVQGVAISVVRQL